MSAMLKLIFMQLKQKDRRIVDIMTVRQTYEQMDENYDLVS